MKKIDFKKVLFMICGVMAFCPVFSSCSMDDPQPIPAEEAYLRAFIKQYGLISPDQDWNQAERASVTIVTENAKEINVFVKYVGKYYRVANYLDVTGTVEIPLDMPEGTETLYVEVDDVFYSTSVGGTVDTTIKRHSVASRAGEGDDIGWTNWAWESGKTNCRVNIAIPYTSERGEYINVPLNQYFYGPNPYDGTDWSTYDGTPLNCEANALTLAPDNGNPMYAYAQMYNKLHEPEDGNPQYSDRQPSTFLLKFTTNTTEAAQVYLKVLGGYVEDLIELSPGEKEHEYLIKNVPGRSWIQMCFKAISGSTVLSNLQIQDFTPDDMAWLLVAEDLGATDDFDFNDVIIQIKAVTANRAALNFEVEKWQVIEDDDEHLVLHAPSRAETFTESYTKLHITSMCAGGTLDSYLHFRLDNDNDFILKPGTDDVDLTTATPNRADSIEWHSWFVYALSDVKNNRYMLNTGLTTATTKSATIIVPDEFSMTTYSQIFQDYDGVKDDINDAPYNIDDFTYTAWSYGNNPNYKIRGFYITVGGPYVDDCERILGQPKAGAAPQIFLIPDIGRDGNWQWAKERVPLTSVYPRFAGWVKGNDTDWYMDEPIQSANTKEGETMNPAYMSR